MFFSNQYTNAWVLLALRHFPTDFLLQGYLALCLPTGMGIFVCLYLFMNFVLEGTLKTNFPGTSLSNCAAVPLASLDSANFFDNLKTP